MLGEDLRPQPIWFTDSPELTEADQPRSGDHVSLRPPRFVLIPGLTVAQLRHANNWGGLAATVLRRSGEIVAHLRHKRVDAVIGCSGNPFDLPAAWLASLRLRLPFVAWLFDDPVMQWPVDEVYRGFGYFWERLWAQTAADVIVPNEAMAAVFAARRPKAAGRIVLIRNPAASHCFEAPPPVWPEAESRRIIVYTGSVYSAQADAFRNLVSALDRLGGRFELHIYTAQSQSHLANLGVAGGFVVHHSAISHRETIAVQRGAQVLFLPLAFESPIEEVILSSAPGKTGEYLASGRPILVHAPRGSFIADFVRRTGAGMLVDTPDPTKLAEALARLDDSGELRDQLSAHAIQAAEEFRPEHVRRHLASALAAIKERRA